MKTVSLAVLVAVMAVSLLVGCASTGPTATTTAETSYVVSQGKLGLTAQEDPAFSLGHPFRLLAHAIYPIGLFLQRTAEFPYVVGMRIDPALFGISEVEQQYLQRRWPGVRPGPNPDAPAGGESATR